MFLTLLLASLGAVATPSANRVVSTGSCRDAADSSAAYIARVRTTLFAGDSVTIVGLGVPYKPSAVQLVTDTAKCTALVQAYNNGFAPADSCWRVTSAYVVQAGTSYVLIVPAESGAEQQFYVFDTSYNRLAILVDPK
jgi:hypothetical protein